MKKREGRCLTECDESHLGACFEGAEGACFEDDPVPLAQDEGHHDDHHHQQEKRREDGHDP